MAPGLAPHVQVRKESWGLLFYHQQRHKVTFVKSGDWLSPAHFDGSWTIKSIAEDISKRTGASLETVNLSLPKLTRDLFTKKLITNEVR